MGPLTTCLASAVCIVGPNGVGKSTLLLLLTGKLTPVRPAAPWGTVGALSGHSSQGWEPGGQREIQNLRGLLSLRGCRERFRSIQGGEPGGWELELGARVL